MTLQETANTALVALIQGATDAANFLKGEVPLAVKELLTYYTAIYAAQLGLGLLMVGVWGTALHYVLKYGRGTASRPGERAYTHYDEPAFVLPIVFVNGFGGIITICVLADALTSLLKITLAPRIWLLEYAAHLVK